nr:HK97-gp10 family putative phage morphogenesis protein [uncultured Celeribacter sp.]
MAKAAKIQNLLRLERKLSRLPKETKKRIREAMRRAADEIVAMMKSLVPVDDGTLQESIGWTWGAAPSGTFVIASLKGAGVGGDMTITIFAGGKEAYYARWQEFGTVSMPASPYFFVSWRAANRGRKGAKAQVRKAVREAAREVAKSK